MPFYYHPWFATLGFAYLGNLCLQKFPSPDEPCMHVLSYYGPKYHLFLRDYGKRRYFNIIPMVLLVYPLFSGIIIPLREQG